MVELLERRRRDYARCKSAQEDFDRASRARATGSDPVKQAQIQGILPDLGYKFREADSLEQKSRMELESLRTQLTESEAHFAQAEIFRFIESNRRKFTPVKIACAMAGLPHITARVSCELCAQFGIKSSHGVAFEIFQIIERMVREPIRDPPKGSYADLTSANSLASMVSHSLLRFTVATQMRCP